MQYTTAFQEFLESQTPSLDSTVNIVKRLILAIDEDRTRFMELMDSLSDVKHGVSDLRQDVQHGFQEVSGKFDTLDTSLTDLRQEVQHGFQEVSGKFDSLDDSVSSLKKEVSAVKQEVSEVKQEIVVGFTQTNQLLLNMHQRLEQIAENTKPRQKSKSR